MDSFTQIVLGAACGEAVLGKKVGNRAMLWGALGGTIPDLDVLGNFLLSDMQALAFHRGITHSLFFAMVTPFLFSWLPTKLYDSGLYQKKSYKVGVFIFAVLLITGIALIINFATKVIGGSWNYLVTALSVGIVIWAITHLIRHYLTQPLAPVQVSRKEWAWLFFWSIFTHPLLDTFTAFGTQLFAPFSSYRASLSTISVADPLYTVPFLLCLIGAAFLRKDLPARRYLNYLGIAWSCSYLLFTVFNKMKIDRIYEQSFQVQNIDYQRFRTGPTIFNNILWNGVAETEDAYYYGLYSMWDEKPQIDHFYKVPKNHQLIDKYESDKDIKILQWFTDGYYTVMPMPDNQLLIGDLRYGTVAERVAEPEDYVFKFLLTPNQEGGIDAEEARDMDRRSDAFKRLWKRIKGK